MSIKHFRELNNMSQTELANKIGVDQTAISQWERGVCFPRPKIALKLADLFHCSLDELYRGCTETEDEKHNQFCTTKSVE